MIGDATLAVGEYNRGEKADQLIEIIIGMIRDVSISSLPKE